MPKLSATDQLNRHGKSSRISRDQPVQSVLFEKAQWNAPEAAKLLSRHDVKVPRAIMGSTKAKFMRFQQRTTGAFKFGSLRTVDTRFPGVQAVVGELKKKSKNPSPMLKFIDHFVEGIET